MEGAWLSAACLLCLALPRPASGGFEPTKHPDDQTFASEDPANYQVKLTGTISEPSSFSDALMGAFK